MRISNATQNVLQNFTLSLLQASIEDAGLHKKMLRALDEDERALYTALDKAIQPGDVLATDLSEEAQTRLMQYSENTYKLLTRVMPAQDLALLIEKNDEASAELEKLNAPHLAYACKI